MGKVIVLLGDGFEEIEGLTVVDVLRRAKIDVESVSIMTEQVITGSRNIKVVADKMFDDIDSDELDMVVLPGGIKGTDNIKAHEGVNKLLLSAKEKGLKIAAICAAPTALGKIGLLKGYKATCFPGLENELTGAECVDNIVITDGYITTSKGPATAMDFALELVKILKDENVLITVKDGLLFDH